MGSKSVNVTLGKIASVIQRAKRIARRYKTLTGRPLGITGEVGEYEAARLLGLELVPAREVGYDAIQSNGPRRVRIQVKARCLTANCKPGQRLGRIDINKKWDKVLLVLLDEDFEPVEIHEASRRAVVAALTVSGSKARNVRGQLGVNRFKAIGKLVWPTPVETHS
jgi:hypothetical protein